jgi:(1->4)-alpha-D-glucan 1-alpha-D-glucosylmutase
VAYLRSQSSVLTPDASGLSECLDRLAAHKHEQRPLSTYRLQFHAGFGFEQARGLVGYLKELGISHVYASPLLKARTGSLHGYDITDHNQLNPEIGTEQDFDALLEELKAHDMGVVLDIVPNHMGIGLGDNPWWQDVLENGRASVYADFFDIDWNPLKSELRDKVLLPTLGDQYGIELERGHIQLHYENGRFFCTYFDKHLPIDTQSIPLIFEPLGDFRARLNGDPGGAALGHFESLVVEMRNLPPNQTSDPSQGEQRRRAIPELRQRLARLVDSSAAIRGLVDQAVALCNGHPGNSRSFDALHRLLEAQPYRLAHWRVSAEEINYRRFFDINDLVGLRMENPRVFAETHQLIRRMLAHGSISGLRVDHPDGLFNPRQYFTRVQMLHAAAHCVGPEPRPPLADNGIEAEVQEIFGQHDWMNRRAPLYVLVEKILERGEELPREWPVDGTSGYDFANLVNGLLIDGRSRRAFTNLFRRFTGVVEEFEVILYDSKKTVMHTALSSEVAVLTHMLDEISSTERRARDFTRKALRDAIRETIACFPVYRTYIDERGEVPPRDQSYITQAIGAAKRRNAGMAAAIFDFLRDILLLKDGNASQWNDAYRARLQFTLKFQQLTGPVMAKGLEDTACYVYNRLISVNEVGGSPQEFGVTVQEFHEGNQQRAEFWPYSMLATSTHDTKRSEDVRARINVLSEMPKQWATQAMHWRHINRSKKKTLLDGRIAPDHNEEYLLYQTLLGCWPFDIASQREAFTRRVQDYMTKAVHEAKVNLSWINPDAEYVEAVRLFVARLLTPGTTARPNHFLESFEKFVVPIQFFGALNSVAQTLLKLTAPGVPDIYQGNELFDFSLVDPDNRRPVDFETRSQRLAQLKEQAQSLRTEALCAELLRSYGDGRLKLWTILRALRFRQEHASLFQAGSYLGLGTEGEKREHLVAFARGWRDQTAIVALPRLCFLLTSGEMRPPLGEVWQDTVVQLPKSGTYWNVLTDEMIDLAGSRSLSCKKLFACFPAALLVSR